MYIKLQSRLITLLSICPRGRISRAKKGVLAATAFSLAREKKPSLVAVGKEDEPALRQRPSVYAAKA